MIALGLHVWYMHRPATNVVVLSYLFHTSMPERHNLLATPIDWLLIEISRNQIWRCLLNNYNWYQRLAISWWLLICKSNDGKIKNWNNLEQTLMSVPTVLIITSSLANNQQLARVKVSINVMICLFSISYPALQFLINTPH